MFAFGSTSCCGKTYLSLVTALNKNKSTSFPVSIAINSYLQELQQTNMLWQFLNSVHFVD